MQNKLVRIFYWVFAVCFAFVALNVIFANEYFNTVPLIITSIICLALLSVLYKLLEKCKNITDRQYKRILIIYAAVMFIIEMLTALMLRHGTWFDIEAIHKGAAEWAETGTFKSYYLYFYQCKNNIGPLVFLYIFFKSAHAMGITDYYLVAAVIMCFMTVVTMILVSLICRRMRDVKHGIFALVIFALSVQFYSIGAAVYTDGMSMLFPVLCYWLYLKSQEMHGRKCIMMYVLIGVSAAIGTIVKFTVAIAVVAIIIDMCLKKKPKEIITAAVCMVGIIALLMTSLNMYIFSTHLNRKDAAYYRRPLNHWIMMGLKGDGRYNPDDFELTDQTAPNEREKMLCEEILRRVNMLGIRGLYKLACRKSAINFGDGTYGYAEDFFRIYPETDTELHNWLLPDGEHYKAHAVYATSMHIALMLIMIFNAFAVALRKSDKEKELFVPYLAFFGVWLFLLCWETNRRYFSNFAPMMFICASVGMYSFSNAIDVAVRKLTGGKNAK